MKKTAVIYWSGTGNTEAMAKAVAEAAGAELFTASEFSAAKADEFDAIAFGCPAMGAEALEESEFEPMFDGVKSRLAGTCKVQGPRRRAVNTYRCKKL